MCKTLPEIREYLGYYNFEETGLEYPEGSKGLHSEPAVSKEN